MAAACHPHLFKSSLESERDALHNSMARDMSARDFLPGMIVACGAILALVIVATNSDVHEPSPWKLASRILWTNASTRPPLLLVLAVAGWAWVVQVCRSCGMKIDLVLGGPTQPVSATYHAALTMLCVVLCARCEPVEHACSMPVAYT